MAEQSQCQLCEGHTREWDLAQSTLSILRNEIAELRLRESEAIIREGSTKEQLLASLRREESLIRLLDGARRGWPQITEHAATCLEPPKVSQNTTDLLPLTPVQLTSGGSMPQFSPGDVDLTVDIPTTRDAKGATAVSFTNLETSENTSLVKLPSVIPEVQLPEITLLPGTEGERETEGGVIEETVSPPLALRILEQADLQQREKGSQSCETPPRTTDASNSLTRLAATSVKVHEMSASSGSHRKRSRRSFVQAWSDDDEDEVSPAAKKKLFETRPDSGATSSAGHSREEIQSPGSPAESPGRVGIVEMEFGGGITVLEVVAKDLGATPKASRRRLRKRDVDEFEGPAGAADSSGQPLLKEKLRRSDRLARHPPMPSDEVVDEIEDESKNDSDYGSDDESEDESDDESDCESGDEIEASDEGSPEPSESSKIESKSKSKENRCNFINLSDSDSGPPLARRLRSAHPPSRGSQYPESESCESARSRSASDRSSALAVENLLKSSPDDVESDDSDDDDAHTLNVFIVQDSSSSEENASESHEEMIDSDYAGSQGTFRDEIVRNRENLIWDYEGDMLIAIQNNGDVALQAVCALYRQQTRDERAVKSALLRNRRGFDKTNAHRGSVYAHFLTAGDESGQLKKSTRALEAQFPGGLRHCQRIASHHSKQLFAIYSNKEDPFWRKPTG